MLGFWLSITTLAELARHALMRDLLIGVVLSIIVAIIVISPAVITAWWRP